MLIKILDGLKSKMYLKYSNFKITLIYHPKIWLNLLNVINFLTYCVMRVGKKVTRLKTGL